MFLLSITPKFAVSGKRHFLFLWVLNELRCEKTGLRGFRPGPTQTTRPQNMARGLKFRILEVEGLYYPCSENKGAD